MLLRCKSLESPCLSWVKSGKPQIEHMFSALPPIGDILDTTDTHWPLPARDSAASSWMQTG